VIILSPGEVLVEVERSGVVESVHSGHLLVLDPDGNAVYSKGEPEQPVFPRSTLKPVQTVALLQNGTQLDEHEIALSSASHSGSPQHIELIAAELAAAGLTEADLECPPDLPYGEAEKRAFIAAGYGPRRLAMNCSGKHAAMLRTCLANNWELSGYVAPSHPLQRAVADAVADLAGEPIAATGVDGCGAPVLAITLTALARSYQRLATTANGPQRRVADAMRAYPELVAGEARFSTRLVRAIPGLIAKEGAEALYAAVLPDGGTVVVKISDGSMRAAEQALLIGLRRLGVDRATLDEFVGAPVFGGGVEVGTVRPAEN